MRLHSHLSLLVVLAAGACSSAPPPFVGLGRWEPRASIASGARQETAVVVLNDEIVVIGGFDGAGGVTALVEAYAPSTDTWRSLADLPTPLHHANAAVVDGALFVLGSLEGANFRETGRVFAYDAAADAWTERNAMPKQFERGASAVVVEGSTVLLVGGFQRGASSPLVSRYTPATDAWEERPLLPTAFDHITGAVLNGLVHVVAGRTNGGIDNASDLLALEGTTWKPRAPMPTPRAGSSGAVVDGKLIVLGGEGGRVFQEVERYDPSTDVWERLTDMETPRHGMGIGAVDGVIYVPGGGLTEGLGPTDVNERFLPDDA
jgi:N-acetylneuraminic acid mutarotase